MEQNDKSETNDLPPVIERVNKVDVYTDIHGDVCIVMARDDCDEDALVWFPKSRAKDVILAIRQAVKGER